MIDEYKKNMSLAQIKYTLVDKYSETYRLVKSMSQIQYFKTPVDFKFTIVIKNKYGL